MPSVQDFAKRSCLYNDGLISTFNFFTNSANFFSGQSSHHGDARDIGWPSSQAILTAGNVNECGLGNLCKLAIANSRFQESPSNRPKDQE